jgi:hypothetical protein
MTTEDSLHFRSPSDLSQSQSQSYFTTGGLPPISSFLRRATWDSRVEFFSQLNTCSHSPYITSSLTRGRVCHLQLLLALVSAFILGSEARGTREHILLSTIRDFPFCRLLGLDELSDLANLVQFIVHMRYAHNHNINTVFWFGKFLETTGTAWGIFRILFRTSYIVSRQTHRKRRFFCFCIYSTVA